MIRAANPIAVTILAVAHRIIPMRRGQASTGNVHIITPQTTVGRLEVGPLQAMSLPALFSWLLLLSCSTAGGRKLHECCSKFLTNNRIKVMSRQLSLTNLEATILMGNRLCMGSRITAGKRLPMDDSHMTNLLTYSHNSRCSNSLLMKDHLSRLLMDNLFMDNFLIHSSKDLIIPHLDFFNIFYLYAIN